jgi:endonuclease YncB( thermonuclease family)
MADISETYNSLKDRATAILDAGKQRAALAVERERVQTYWEVGDILHAHLLAHKDRAGYGEQTVARLARDLSLGERRLYEMLALRRAFPILRPVAELGWTHYTAVLPLKTKAQRTYYLRQAAAGQWSKRELQTAIKADAFGEKASAEQNVPKDVDVPQATHSDTASRLVPKRGILYRYRTAKPDEPDADIAVDLGFGPTHSPYIEQGSELEPGTLVSALRTAERPDCYALEPIEGLRSRVYTYKAKVLRVVDGDTLLVNMDLGFRICLAHKLRLRGIDTPEMSTKEGKHARTFVRRRLSQVPWVVITTWRPDKYGRYLSDVFYDPDEQDPHVVAREGKYLNGELLKAGLAVRYSG